MMFDRGGSMNRRIILLWAACGLLVAACWAEYAALTSPPTLTSSDPLMPLVEITCPIAAASLHLHFGVSMYGALAANTLTYGLIGLMIEVFRRRTRLRTTGE